VRGEPNALQNGQALRGSEQSISLARLRREGSARCAFFQETKKMLRQSLLGLGAAGLLASGILAGAATSASAHNPYPRGSGIYFSFGVPPYGYSGGHRVCKPIIKKVKWYDRKGRPHWSRKVVDHRCWWEPGYGYGWSDWPYNSPVYRIGPGNRWLGGW
jgi:hypothetical protein